MTERRENSTRPFPHACAHCGKGEIWPAVIPYDAEVKHDGRLYKFHIRELRVNRCNACGEVYFDAVTDAQITQGLREQLPLLSPDEIREGIQSLGLTQRGVRRTMRDGHRVGEPFPGGSAGMPTFQSRAP